MTKHTKKLALFTKYPIPNMVKTRLIGALGPEGAADLHREMTRHVFSVLERTAHFHGAALEVWFDGADEAAMVEFLGSNVPYRQQVGADLGERMARAFDAGFQSGIAKMIVVGSDCPALNRAILGEAIDVLSTHDLVFGPALDGGYYLVGMSRPVTEIFERIPWSTDEVLSTTRERINEVGATVGYLDPLPDVDGPADLPNWYPFSSAATEKNHE